MISQPYNLLSLSALLKEYGESAVQKILNGFNPLEDSSTSDFLAEKAIQMEKRDLSRTYLAISDSNTIMGFFTLGLKCIRFTEDSLLSNKVMNECNMEPSTKVAQAYLLGQLARSADSPKGFGDILIKDATRVLKTAKAIVGCRMLRLDCVDELVPYYSKHGFIKIRKNIDKDLNQMMVFI